MSEETTDIQRRFLRTGTLRLPADRPLIRKACDHIESLETELHLMPLYRVEDATRFWQDAQTPGVIFFY